MHFAVTTSFLYINGTVANQEVNASAPSHGNNITQEVLTEFTKNRHNNN